MAIIKTKRLILREWIPQDLEPFTSLNQDPKVLEYLSGPLNAEECAEWIKRIDEHFKKYGFGLWAASLQSTSAFIGYIGLNVPQFEAHFTPCVEIGWRLMSDYWGQGYATEGALAVLHYAFNNLGLQEVVSFTVPANTRSIRVMEKIGITRDLTGDFRHPNLPQDHPLSLHVLYRIKRQ